MTKRRLLLFSFSILLLLTWFVFSALYSSNVVYAEDALTPEAITTIDITNSAFPTFAESQTSTPTIILTPTNTPVISELTIGTPDVIGTISALQFALTESATNIEVDRINIQPTLSSFEFSISEISKQQERLSRMQLIVFCFIGIIVLGMIIYSTAKSKRNSSIQKKIEQSKKTSPPHNQNISNNTHELERRLENAEQEALIAKKVSQETHSHLRELEAKIIEQDNIISSLKISKETKQLKTQEPKNQEVLQSPSEIVTTKKIKDEVVLNVFRAYNELAIQENEKFILLDRFITHIIDSKLAHNEADVYKILEYVIQKKPGAIRIETIRGKTGKHIAIFKEYI